MTAELAKVYYFNTFFISLVYTSSHSPERGERVAPNESIHTVSAQSETTHTAIRIVWCLCCEHARVFVSLSRLCLKGWNREPGIRERGTWNEEPGTRYEELGTLTSGLAIAIHLPSVNPAKEPWRSTLILVFCVIHTYIHTYIHIFIDTPH